MLRLSKFDVTSECETIHEHPRDVDDEGWQCSRSRSILFQLGIARIC